MCNNIFRLTCGFVALAHFMFFVGSLFSGKSYAEEFWPGAQYDADTPTIRSLLGYEPGTELTNTLNIEHYLKALESAHPDNLRLFQYGRSWQGRSLNYAVISSRENLARLDELKIAYKEFADPRQTSKSQMQNMIAGLPAVVWLGYGVHGNEVSPPDAALQVAYHLLASKDSPMVDEILNKVILLLDPIQNPDGREKFIHHFNNNRGPQPDGFEFAAERKEGWNHGRTNHYLFDLNRDWAAMTQPETQGRVKLLSDWLPMVAVDVHEFGSDYTYFFTPEADPYNPYITETQKQSLEIIGKNNAKWFDKRGWRYFTREIYDAFFPGYGAGWPVFYGALGMTYEQASPRGLKATNKIGETFTYKDAVTHHFVASISTLQAVAENKKLLMQRFWEYRHSAVEVGKRGDVKQAILSRSTDHFNSMRLARLLKTQGIEISTANSAFKACGNKFMAGDYVINMAQPHYRMIRNYLDKHIPMEASFVAYQENLRRLHKNHVLYDVTAWSKRLMYNVDVTYCDEKVKVATSQLPLSEKGELKTKGTGHLAWLVNWQDTATAHFMIAALREGIEIWSSDKAFVQNGTTYDEGSLIIYQQQGESNQNTELRSRVHRLAADFGIELIATDSVWVDAGVNFGSQHVVKMKSPKIAMLWDRPVNSYLAGATRFSFEQTLKHPVTTIATRFFNKIDLSQFDVLVMPGGTGYKDYINDVGAANLNAWLRQGGVLIALGNAIDYTSKHDISELKVEPNLIDGSATAKLNSGAAIINNADGYEAIQVDPQRKMEKFAGVILKALPNPDHWMTVGIDKPIYTLATGHKTYSPLHRGQGVNVVHFAGAEEVLASGYLWQGYEKQLAYKPYITLEYKGKGMVVSFVESPTFRAHQPGLEMLFVNTIWRAVAHTRANIRNGR